MSSISGRMLGKQLVKGEESTGERMPLLREQKSGWQLHTGALKSFPHSAPLEQIEEEVTIGKIYRILIIQMVKGEAPMEPEQHFQLLFLNKVASYCKNSQVA